MQFFNVKRGCNTEILGITVCFIIIIICHNFTQGIYKYT